MLFRMEDIELSNTVETIIIHCGTNNLMYCQPSDIASRELATGATAKRKREGMKVIIMGLLHCDLDTLNV